MLIANRSIYLAGLLLLCFLFLLSVSKYKDLQDAKRNGQSLSVKIKEIDCNPGRIKHSAFVFRLDGKNHLVVIDADSCRNYKVGQSITVLYNNEPGIYYSINHKGTDEFVGMVGFGILAILLFGYIFVPRFFKYKF